MSNIKVKYFEVDSNAVAIKIEYINSEIISHLDYHSQSKSIKIDDWEIQIYLASHYTTILDCRRSDKTNKRLEIMFQDTTKYSTYLGNEYVIVDKHGESFEDIITFYNKLFNHLSNLIKE